MAEISITQADIENVFGADFVAQWSSFSQGVTPVVNTTRTATACAMGKSMVNSRLHTGPYAIPLSGNVDEVPEVIDAMATLAGWWLFKSRGINYTQETNNWMKSHYRRVMEFLDNVRTGSDGIACAYNTGRRQTPFVV